MGDQPREVEPARHGAPGEDRLQLGNAELGRLLDQVVDAQALDRREEQPEVGLGPLRAPLDPAAQKGGSLAEIVDRRGPLAVAAVEERHRGAGGEPQHVAQVVGLRDVERDGRAGGEVGGDVEAGGGRRRRAHASTSSAFGILKHAHGISCPPLTSITWPVT